MSNVRRDPRVPTMPTGVEVASYPTYLEAQQAVDHLSDRAFDVKQVTIVGSDLRMVERVTGRLTYARVAGAGAMSGAWFGLMISLVYWIFSPQGDFPLLAGVLIGAAFGILFALVSYALTGGKRDFTSTSQVVASRYAVLSSPELAGQARAILTEGDRTPRGAAGAGGSGAGDGGSVSRPGGGPTSPSGGGPASGVPWSGGAENPYAAPGTAGTGAPGGAHAPGTTPVGTPGAGAGQGEPGAPAEPPRRPERPRYGVRLEDLDTGDQQTRERGEDRG